MMTNSLQASLDNIAKSISAMDARIGSMEIRVGGIETHMVTRDDLDGLYASIFKLETIIKREAGDLGESIASLTNMVAKEFGSLAITRSNKA